MKEVQCLVGRLIALSRFIPRLAEREKSIIIVMRKNSSSKWYSSCEEAFGEVKKILANPPIMGKWDGGSELQLYLAVTDTTVSTTLTQEAPEFKLIYFVSRVLKETKVRYKQVEKVALALLTTS